MLAGAAKIDITPTAPVWMDGMIRAHRSLGVHDALYARCLVLGNERGAGQASLPGDGLAIVSVEVCALDEATCREARQAAFSATGIPTEHIIIAATHTHSGPATFGFFNPREDEYTAWLASRLATVVGKAAANLHPAAVGCGSGREETISYYRRLLADDGHVVMNWEPYPPERLRGPLGEADREVGVLKVTRAGNPQDVLALLINHSGHPNVMSGDSYLISSDYPGKACRILEERHGGVALFVNGAQGSVDIDGLRHRDWEGVERLGARLADSVSTTAARISPASDTALAVHNAAYHIPARRITDSEWDWAQGVLRRTGGAVRSLPDGVGDDYLALLYQELRGVEEREVAVEQTCLGVGDSAWVSFPGELYTEIGVAIKKASPFPNTYVLGLANGYAGYVPTSKAIEEGGYAEDTRRVDAASERIITERSLSLLRYVRDAMSSLRGEGSPAGGAMKGE